MIEVMTNNALLTTCNGNEIPYYVSMNFTKLEYENICRRYERDDIKRPAAMATQRTSIEQRQ